jgi:lysophospholipase L1-like esterase
MTAGADLAAVAGRVTSARAGTSGAGNPILQTAGMRAESPRAGSGMNGTASSGGAGSSAVNMPSGRGVAGASAGDATTAGAGGASGATATSGATGAAGAASGAYEPCPRSGDACKILPLGDSITYGLGYAGGYRVQLFHKAQAAGQHITFVGSLSNGPNMVDGVSFPKQNEGHSGWKIDQLLPLIPSPALTDKPQIILLMIGTNDIAQNDDVTNAPKRLGGLLDKVIMAAPDTLIVVGNITPLNRGSEAVDRYNAAIPAQVEARASAGKHILFVDLHAVVTTAMLADGVHPNKEGSDHMADVFYQAIGSLLH